MNIDKDNKKSLLVKKAVEYIEDHFKEDICLDDICESLGYSKYYVSYVFPGGHGAFGAWFYRLKKTDRSKELVVRGSIDDWRDYAKLRV